MLVCIVQNKSTLSLVELLVANLSSASSNAYTSTMAYLPFKSDQFHCPVNEVAPDQNLKQCSITAIH